MNYVFSFCTSFGDESISLSRVRRSTNSYNCYISLRHQESDDPLSYLSNCPSPWQCDWFSCLSRELANVSMPLWQLSICSVAAVFGLNSNRKRWFNIKCIHPQDESNIKDHTSLACHQTCLGTKLVGTFFANSLENILSVYAIVTANGNA